MPGKQLTSDSKLTALICQPASHDARLETKGALMSYDAKVFNVMIASPGDVASERNIVREVVHEWNTVHSYTRHLVLMPISWETHSSPEMGGTPQEIIDEQVLEKCDLLVGVFWTRIGTKTDEYISGTVEEIERHIESGKPTMIYFSNQPVRPDSVDAEQYAKLKDFKNSCQNRGLYEIYDTLSEFRDKFYRQLQLKINEDEYFSIPETIQNSTPILESSRLPIPALSDKAGILLKEASQDKDGIIMFLRDSGGTDLQTNGKNLIADKSPRTTAAWKAALNELIENELAVERGYKGEIFELTGKGYQVADTIEL